MEHWKVVTLLLIVYDFLAVILSYFAALWLRFDCKFNEIELPYLQVYYHTILIYAVFCIIVFWCFRLYKSIWRFASYSELLRMIFATAVTSMVYTISVTGFILRMPVSYYLSGLLIQFTLTLGVRFSYRFILLLRAKKDDARIEKRVMLIGAGNAGQMILRDIRNTKEIDEKVYCFIDDD